MTAPLLPLDRVKALLGLPAAPDAVNDPKLTAALPVVTEYFENYCKRGLALVADVIEEQAITGARVALFRFPVSVVTELTVGGVAATPPVPPALDAARGFIRLAYAYCWPTGDPVAHVKYTGGYPDADVPADLADAYARCVADYAGVAHAASTGGGGAPLKSLGLGSGALTVSFETGAQSAYDTSSVPPLLAPYLFALDHYRVKDYV